MWQVRPKRGEKGVNKPKGREDSMEMKSKERERKAWNGSCEVGGVRESLKGLGDRE